MTMPGPATHLNLTADSVIKAAAGQLVACVLTGGSAAATLTLYDNATIASGTVLAVIKAPVNTSFAWAPPTSYVAANGIFADIAGTGADATVVFL